MLQFNRNCVRSTSSKGLLDILMSTLVLFCIATVISFIAIGCTDCLMEPGSRQPARQWAGYSAVAIKQSLTEPEYNFGQGKNRSNNALQFPPRLFHISEHTSSKYAACTTNTFSSLGLARRLGVADWLTVEYKKNLTVIKKRGKVLFS